MTNSPNQSDDIVGGKLLWNKHIDLMLARWCDQAKCFEWMHSKAHSMYENRYRKIIILTSLLSIAGGVGNVATSQYSDVMSLGTIFGSITILIGGINFLQDKLSYNTLATQHNSYSTTWGGIRRRIEEEINIPYVSRKDCGTFLKYIRDDINKVSTEGDSKIPDHIKSSCYDKFNNIPNFDIPDICGQIEHTDIYIDDEHIPLLANVN